MDLHTRQVTLNSHFPKKTESLQFYDFGPKGNYWESPKALRVVSRVPAGAFWSPPKKHLTPGHFWGF